MDAHSIYQQIISRTRTKFGHSVNPHLFRDAAATTVAIHDPERVRSTRCLLGHSKYATTERHYVQAQSLEASRRYQKRILELRKGRASSSASTL